MKETEDAIYDTLSACLLGGRLSPGTPLRETALAEVFGISRERLRKILLRLHTNRLIEMVPNRGAFVGAPSLEQAREVYEARRVLEGGIVAHLAPTLSIAQAERLKAHMAQEAQAFADGNRAESVRLSAYFHTILAEATGNTFVVQQMQELVSRTSLMVAMYESAAASQCGCEEHRDIFSALLRGDGPGATRAMGVHLSLVETRLRPGMVAPSADAVGTLRALWARRAEGTEAMSTASTSEGGA